MTTLDRIEDGIKTEEAHLAWLQESLETGNKQKAKIDTVNTSVLYLQGLLGISALVSTQFVALIVAGIWIAFSYIFREVGNHLHDDLISDLEEFIGSSKQRLAGIIRLREEHKQWMEKNDPQS